MMQNAIEKLKYKFREPDLKVVIIPHISPDGDAVGACSALSEVLKKVRIEHNILTCDYVPDYLKFLENIPSALSYQENQNKCKALIHNAGLIVMIDHNTIKREGDLEQWVREADGEKAIIDHHPCPDTVDYMVSDTSVSSTCELLYSVITEIWGKEVIDANVANSLYTGINTDTGGLSHNSSHPETYRIIAGLLEAGLNKEFVHEHIYQMNNLSRLRLIGNALLNKLSVNPDYPVAIIPITLEELERYNYKDGDLEGLVNIPLSVENIQVAIQITQRKERVKLSFRSKGKIPVNEWAKAFFNGGGHLNAAGGQMDLPLEEVIRKVDETTAWFFNTYYR